MRIDRLHVENFKGFEVLDLDLAPHFTLLAGDNGSGKTSALDALAVSLGLWHKAAPRSGWRNILTEEIRLEPRRAGDRTIFEQRLPARVVATGPITLNGPPLTWTRMIRESGTRTTNAEARTAEAAIQDLVARNEEPLPVLAYYGAGRAWLPTNKRPSAAVTHRRAQRFDAYHSCLDARIHEQDINEWFLFEAAVGGGPDGRPGLRAVKNAILGCIPGADGLRYDSDHKEIVLSMGGAEQPFYNLSAGHRMMLALVADVAIKAVTLNSYLFGPGRAAATDPARLLAETPGVVLVDELDVHLHPKWQRRVASDLKRTFPRIQFVCTSHSPQVIGELLPAEIRLFEDGGVVIPRRSFGLDSSRVLTEVQGAEARDPEVGAKLHRLFKEIDEQHFAAAQEMLVELAGELEDDAPELTRARTLMAFLEEPG